MTNRELIGDRRAWALTIAGTCASVAVAVGGVLDGWAGINGVWFTVNPLGSHPTLGKALMIGGAFVLIGLWLGTLLLLRRVRTVPIRAIVVVFVMWALPLVVGPPLFSKDAYAYSADGALLSHGFNPYTHGVDALGNGNKYVAKVDPVWRGAAVPDGLLMVAVEAGAVRLSGDDQLGTLELLRLVELAALALAAWAVSDLARTAGRDPTRALALSLLNPVTLLAIVADANEHIVMIGLLAAGIALSRRGRPVFAVLVCTLAAAVKAPALLGIAYVGWGWPGPRAAVRDRLLSVAAAAAITAVSFELVQLVTGLGWGWIRGIRDGASIPTVYTPTFDLSRLAVRVLGDVGDVVNPHRAWLDARDLGYAVGAAALGVLLWTSERRGAVRNLGLSLLVVATVGAVTLSYWLAWGIWLLAPVARGRYLALLIATSITAALLILPQATTLIQSLGAAGEVLCLLVAAAIALIPTDFVTGIGTRAYALVAGARPVRA
jgi:alpha-1,6-mannosyltransferase